MFLESLASSKFNLEPAAKEALIKASQKTEQRLKDEQKLVGKRRSESSMTSDGKNFSISLTNVNFPGQKSKASSSRLHIRRSKDGWEEESEQAEGNFAEMKVSGTERI